MKHITDLNRERNQEIIEQAREINELLLANNITPIFLKGTGNLLEGLYVDIGERMVGDIDFIVSKDAYEKTINLLKIDKYKPTKDNDTERKFHWHYKRSVKEGRIAAIEVHNKILKKPHESILNFKDIAADLIYKSGFYFLSNKNKILNAVLPKIINDNLYHSKTITLRTAYDVFLIAKKGKYTIILENKKILKKFNNFYGCIKMILNNENDLIAIDNRDLSKFKVSYLKILENSKKERLIYNFKDYLVRIKKRFEIVTYSFTDKEYRDFAIKRIFQISLYKKLLGIKPTS